MFFSKQLKLIRKEESLTQTELSQLTDIPIRTIEKYEQGVSEPTLKNMKQITEHPMLKKYTLWLMTGTTAPESGQVCPAFSTNQDTHEKSGSVRKKA
ncbi:helix-turn-helix domain-containing protein [Shewanella sp. D64]|uniref:helix-turn-helix domain-containing protein n=1 Tax=unclassified Shewanella TaxID=196818 RepID=UPI0022BA5F95|nr:MULTISPECIES: helix-turn-helix transcriptional regulator [unclassified Shewanella]MEC4724667.1 helix-turn-helix domain-containing protein [Shewanella sp. D64]MEC4736556.1 helix-turn-helix domain-containing protein [Shewanella sp. E94]WBJ94767.1 helix-turn-helix domain-containing protein [Shewanella sp. MTB7]